MVVIFNSLIDDLFKSWSIYILPTIMLDSDINGKFNAVRIRWLLFQLSFVWNT